MRGGRVTRWFDRGRRRRTGLVCGAVALVFAMGTGAFAGVMNNVVQPTGSVAGHDYTYWLKRAWKFYFTSSAPCQTTNIGGKPATLAINAKGGHSSCHAAAGKPI